MRAILPSALALSLLAGCGSDDSTAPAPMGTASLNFSISNGARQNPGLVDPLQGAVYGSLFKSEEVTLAGPIDGAADVASVEVGSVDLVAVAPSAERWSSPKLPPGMYTFLGFFDVDGNGAASKDPDAGDPVTLPLTNKFEVTADETVEFEVQFDLIFN